MPRIARLAAPAATVLAVFILTAAPAWACKDGKATDVAALEARPADAALLLPMINAERSGAGLRSLSIDAGATAIATDFARQLAARGDLWHNDAYFTSTTRASLRAIALGENVACNWDLAAVHAALMASTGHRANVLDPRFTGVGIAVVARPDGAIYVVQDFLQGSGAAPAAAPVAAPAPSAAVAP